MNKVKFIEDNYSWLEKWLDNANVKPFGRSELGSYQENMQIFMENVITKPDTFESDIKRKFDEHKKTILLAAVFSVKDGNGRFSSMSGFVEQTGRLPTPEDKVQILHFAPDKIGDRWLRIDIWEDTDSDLYSIRAKILSDCQVEVL